MTHVTWCNILKQVNFPSFRMFFCETKETLLWVSYRRFWLVWICKNCFLLNFVISIKDTLIIPKVKPYLLELDRNTQWRSLNTILVISGRYDVTMTFCENFVNSQFVDIFAWKIFLNTKSRPLKTILMVFGRHDVIVTFYENFLKVKFSYPLPVSLATLKWQ